MDTETYKIEHAWELPKVVIAQVCDGRNVDIIPWELIPKYFKDLDRMKNDILYFVFNAGFDLPVLGYHPTLMRALEDRRVIDISPRYSLQQIKDTGDNPMKLSLEYVSAKVLLHTMGKDPAIRLSFTREAAPLSYQHIMYAAEDPAVTFMLAEAIEPQFTEDLQTQATFTLSEMSRTGIPVDSVMMTKVRNEYLKRKEVLEDAMFMHGYDVYSSTSNKDLLNKMFLDISANCEVGSKKLGVTQARVLILDLLTMQESLGYEGLVKRLEEVLPMILSKDKAWMPSMRREGPVRKASDEQFRIWGMEELNTILSPKPFIMLIKRMFKYKKDGLSELGVLEGMQSDYHRYHGWNPKYMTGKQKFLQDYFAELENIYGLEFDRTEATQKIKFGKTEKWKLLEKDIDEPIINDFLDYQHTDKIISTYLNPKMVHADGRYHPRFNVMVRTGRTSCTKPNVQNPPKEGGIRELMMAPPGEVIGAADYSQVELCALAQDCWIRYKYSRMRELINQDLDLHAWYAGRYLKLITPANDYDGTDESADKLRPLLKKIKAEQGKVRDRAKVLNFGAAGGLTAKSYLNRLRDQGIMDVTLAEAEDLHKNWFEAFPEMKDHMRARQVADAPEEYFSYESDTLTGRCRTFCSKNSACNFRFQGLVSDGAKYALWALWRARFKLANFVHDEIHAFLPVSEAPELLKEMERIMVEQMRIVIPDVKIKTEGHLMYRWSKKAKALYDASGRMIPWTEELAKEEKKAVAGEPGFGL